MFKYMSRFFNVIGAAFGVMVVCSLAVDYGRELGRKEAQNNKPDASEIDIFEQLKSKKPYTIRKNGSKYEIEFDK